MSPSLPIRAAWATHLGVAAADLDPEQLSQDLVAGSVPEALLRAATTHPGSTIAVDSDRVTLATLAGEVARQAAALRAAPAEPGAIAVISAPSSLALVRAYLAALWAGFTAVLTNPSYTRAELAEVLRRAGAELLLTEDDQGGVEGLDGVRVLSLGELSQRSQLAEPMPLSAPASTDTALLAFTSGTTGDPKAVPLSHGHLLGSIRAAMWSWRWQDSDMLVHALPLFHQHGLSGIHATLVAGSSAAVLSRFDPDRLLTTIEREGATVLFGVPSIHRRLLELGPGRLAPVRRLRLVTSGSGPLPAPLAQEFREATGVELLERYGLTETGLNVSNPYTGRRVPGSVGLPLPGVEVDLRDAHGRSAADGSEGEIVVRGPQVFDGYRDDEGGNAEAFWPGGWFRTGDIGRWGDDGRLRITGRAKELVITGGMNVSPTEVEAVIEQLPNVKEAAVAGLPSERWGEEVAAWVVPQSGEPLDPEQVIAHCRERLTAYKCPKQVFVTTTLPRNAMGKLLRGELTSTAS